MNPESNPQPLDLRGLASQIWRRKWIMLAIIVVIPVATYLIAHSQTKQYESHTLVVIQPTAGANILGQTQATPATQVFTVSELLQTTALAQQAGLSLTPKATAGEVLGHTTVTADSQSGSLTIVTKTDNPKRAADIANALVNTLQARRLASTVANLNRQIGQVKVQLAALKGSQQAQGQQLVLTSSLEQLKRLKTVGDSGVVVLEPAAPNPSPVSPRPRRDTALAIPVGLIIAFTVLLLLRNLDRRVRETEDIEKATTLPLLSAIPKRVFGADPADPQSAEQFQLLRSALTYFNVDRPVTTVVVTSAVPAEGKTTVATNLAHVWARTGSDVILVDADLRRPRAGSVMHAEQGGGLAAVLVGRADLDSALNDIELKGTTSGRLRVLPAGSSPPNPAELLASERLKDVVARLEEMADLVVIDTSPLLAVSDTFPLARAASGVLLVAKLGSTRSDALGRVVSLLRSADVRILGTVATNGPANAMYGGYYGYYGEDGKRRPKRSESSDSYSESPTT